MDSGTGDGATVLAQCVREGAVATIGLLRMRGRWFAFADYWRLDGKRGYARTPFMDDSHPRVVVDYIAELNPERNVVAFASEPPWSLLHSDQRVGP